MGWLPTLFNVHDRGSDHVLARYEVYLQGELITAKLERSARYGRVYVDQFDDEIDAQVFADVLNRMLTNSFRPHAIKEALDKL